jgi:Big-like domain-containing protein
VSIVEPTDSGSVSRHSTVTILATASDNVRVAGVRFYQDGNLICTVWAAPNRCAWKVPSTPGKTYKLQAKVSDAQGNVGSSSIVTVKAAEGPLAGSGVPAERASQSLAD